MNKAKQYPNTTSSNKGELIYITRKGQYLALDVNSTEVSILGDTLLITSKIKYDISIMDKAELTDFVKSLFLK